MALELTAAIHRELPELRADEDLARETLESTASVIAAVRRPRPATKRRSRRSSRRRRRSASRETSCSAASRWTVCCARTTSARPRSSNAGPTDVRAVLDDPADVAQAIQEVAALTFAFVQRARQRAGAALDRGTRALGALDGRRHRPTRCARCSPASSRRVRGQRAPRLRAHPPAHGIRRLAARRPGRPRTRALGGLDRAASAIADALRGRRPADPRRCRETSTPAGSTAPRTAASRSRAAARRRKRRHRIECRQDSLVSPQSPGGTRRPAGRAALRRRRGSVVSYASVAVAALASVDIERARDFVDATLGPLAGAGDTSRRLAATLRTYLEEGMSPRRTARRLGVHENTVTNRVGVVEERIGDPVGRGRRSCSSRCACFRSRSARPGTWAR